MAEHSTIEWTEATWQIVTGCSIATPGCTNCYAMRLAGSRLQHHPSRVGLTRDTKAGPVWTGEVRFNEQWLTQPLTWKRPRKIFVAAHGDLFHEAVPDDVLDQVFAVMAAAPQHTFQVLTKRSARARAYLSTPATLARIIAALQALSEKLGPGKSSRDPMGFAGWNAFAAAKNLELGNEQSSWPGWPLSNVWLGVSVEDQRRADERIPDLLATPAAVRWISAEPLLGPVNLHQYLLGFPAGHPASCACGHGHGFCRCPNYGRVSQTCHLCACTEFRKAPGSDGLSWVVVGGESGPGARPMHPDWARSLRDQCAAAGVPYLFKQWGAWTPGENVTRRSGKVDTAHLLDDGRWWFADENLSSADGHVDDEPDVYRIGKKAAGRLLDGVTHDGFPASGRVLSGEGSR